MVDVKTIHLYSFMVTLVAAVAIMVSIGITSDHHRLDRAVSVCKSTADNIEEFNACLLELGEP